MGLGPDGPSAEGKRSPNGSSVPEVVLRSPSISGAREIKFDVPISVIAPEVRTAMTAACRDTD